jgi:glycosyltransferase involved in cell wall biosynthesis
MRIAHVISSPAGIGGAERVLLQLAQAGAQRGAEQLILHPFVATGDTALAEQCPPGSYLAHVGSHWQEIPAVRAWLGRELGRFQPQIVHVHLFHALVLVASLRRPDHAELILTHHHGSRYVDERQRVREWADRVCGRRYDTVVAVSEATRRLLVDRYGYAPAKVRTIPNGWSGEPRARSESPGHRIVCVANFRAQKGHEVLLSAFARVVQELPDAQLVLVGDGPLREDLETQAARLAVAHRVRFVGAVEDVWPYLADADVFALASRYEPLGLAALEAMAAGLPVVATSVGGLTDLVEPGVTGELVEPENPAALAERLTALLRSPDALLAMGAEGRRRAASQRADQMSDRYFDVYAELVNGADPSSRTRAR